MKDDFATNHTARLKMSSVIWEHGRKKAELTVIIKKLSALDSIKGPTIDACVELLKRELEKLKQTNPLI